MKTKLTILVALLLAFFLKTDGQINVMLENGEKFQTSSLSCGPDMIKCDQASYKKTDILYYEKNRQYFVYNVKSGRKCRVNFDEDITSSCGIGQIFAYKYYGTKTTPESFKPARSTFFVTLNDSSKYEGQIIENNAMNDYFIMKLTNGDLKHIYYYSVADKKRVGSKQSFEIDQNFVNCYNDKVRSIKVSNTTTNVLSGVLSTISLGLSLGIIKL